MVTYLVFTKFGDKFVIKFGDIYTQNFVRKKLGVITKFGNLLDDLLGDEVSEPPNLVTNLSQNLSPKKMVITQFGKNLSPNYTDLLYGCFH